MKKSLTLFVLFLFVSSVVYSQVPGEKHVPKPVLAKFAAEYPNIKPTRWEAKFGKQYEAVMMHDNKPARARYAADGTPLFLAHHHNAASVPAIITAGVLAEFAGFKVDWATQVQNFKLGTHRYLVHFSKPGYVLKVLINSDGTVHTGKDDEIESISNDK
jgi:hypothetical protein